MASLSRAISADHRTTNMTKGTFFAVAVETETLILEFQFQAWPEEAFIQNLHTLLLLSLFLALTDTNLSLSDSFSLSHSLAFAVFASNEV